MKKFHFIIFLLYGILFGLTACTKETETNQPPAILSPQEATALLARSIESTEDDSLYITLTNSEALKLGIPEEIYISVSKRINLITQNIKTYKTQNFYISNGFKNTDTKSSEAGINQNNTVIRGTIELSHMDRYRMVDLTNYPRLLGVPQETPFGPVSCNVSCTGHLWEIIVSCADEQHYFTGNSSHHIFWDVNPGGPEGSQRIIRLSAEILQCEDFDYVATVAFEANRLEPQ